ncbi:flavin reductase family protein [Cupriavidus numazuensis]|uniref:FMN reductase (NADH) NtaB n=1 Tax=Cupriavidus numazuensis TaxID=221992 RepID=A0ABM8TJS1_9BURK|nr:flavin reductase family protein [Cupriavidus numazuensis]CAG2150329.1 FMN reductase (NADH) NtaB [Cupriavidus numazuensis]
MMPALAPLPYATEASNDSGQDEADDPGHDADGAHTVRRALRRALGQFATGVAVVTATGSDGRPVGVTINSLASVSLAPPLLLWSLALGSGSMAAFRAAPCYAVNVLAHTQQALCERFATSGIDRFQGVSLSPGPCGTALIDNALACFVCQPRSARKVGDHVLFIAEIVSYRMNRGEPLVFHAGGFAEISAPSRQ